MKIEIVDNTKFPRWNYLNHAFVIVDMESNPILFGMRTLEEAKRAKSLLDDARIHAMHRHVYMEENDNIVLAHIVKQLSIEFNRPVESFLSSDSSPDFMSKFNTWLTKRPVFASEEHNHAD